MAIETLDADVCVTAGAGSGKTLVLALRYIEILRREKADVNDIVAITFTEKAAREMRQRIRDYCDEEIKSSAGKPELLRKWRGHKQDLEGARISTIHGLCSRILRENPVEAAVDPEFTVLDENAAMVLAARVVNDAVESLLAEDDGHLQRVIEEYGVRPAKDFLRYLLSKREDVNQARELHDKFDDTALMRQYHERLLAIQAGAARETASSGKWQSAISSLRKNKCKDAGDKLYGYYLLALEADRKALEARTDREAALAMTGVLEIKINVGSARNWDDLQGAKDALRSVREMVEALKRLFTAKITDEDIESLGLAWDLLAAHEKVRARYDDAKNEAGVLTFEDLEIRARDLLAENGDVRRELQQNIKFILVDEFQDVNPIQQEIIRQLAGKAERGKTDAPNLFFVGDDKQSIYRFRGADVSVFTKTRREIERSGKVITLDANFRTVRDGVDFANVLFGDLMRKDRATQSYHAIYEDIKATREPLREGPFAEMNLLRFDRENNPGADMLRLMEARAVAKKILELTSSAGRFVYDEGERKWTTPRYRHIAVICRQLKYLVHAYERAFQEAGIPYHVTAGSDFYRRQEVQDVLNVLRVIDNPADDYALAGALRSPMFVLSDESLYWLSALDGNSFAAKFHSGGEPVEMSREEKEKLACARKTIALLRSLKDRISLPELINKILEVTGLEAVLATTFNGTRKIANLRKMVEVARSFEANGIFSLRDFIQYIKNFLTEEMRESQAPIEEEEQDVVRILTVHKAKGLEFPIVFVPDICPVKSGAHATDSLGLSRELGLVPRLRRRPGKDEPSNGAHKLYSLDENLKDAAESKRLLYVAATRARDRLLLSAHLEKGAKPEGWLGDISKALGLSLITTAGPQKSGKSGGTALAVRETECTEYEKALQPARRGSKIQDIIRTVETISRETPPTVTSPARTPETAAPSLAAKKSFNPTELVEYEFCPRKYYYHFVRGYPQILAAPAKEGGVPAAAIGDISHRLFEMLRPGDRDKQILEAINAEGRFTDVQMKELVKTMRGFAEKFDSTPLAGELAAARESWEEVSFAAKCGDAIIEGKMDKVFRDEKGALHILDYKSDLVPDRKFDEKLRRYRLQLAAYAVGLKAALGEAPKSARLYFFRYGETARLPISEEDVEGFKSEILRVIAGIRANRFDRAAGAPCACGFEWLCNDMKGIRHG